MADRKKLERLAFAAWRVYTGREPPTDRVDANGGPLEPGGWCMEAAEAILVGERLPRIESDRDVPQAWISRIGEMAEC